MTSEQRMAPAVRAWLKGTADTPHGVEQGVSRVMTRLPQTRQRGRWWPLPSFQRRTAPAPDIPSAESRPVATQSVDDHPPTVTARLLPMFSATKFVIAGVIVALAGGALLIAQPFERQDGTVPGAATSRPGTFSPAGSLAEPRSNHTATLLPDGRVLVIGGVGEDGSTGSAEVWVPGTASFDPAGSLIQARSHHSATLLPDGRVLVIGGIDGGGGDDGGMLASVEVWDPTTDMFSPAGSLAEARSTHTTTLLRDGRVLVVGGGDHAFVEVWDQTTTSFSQAGSLAQARGGHTATLLSDGRVLVAGGWGGGEGGYFLASAEVWDSATSTFTDAGTMQPALNRPTATLLSDGRVLVIGEGGAQVWDPTTASFESAGSPVGGIHMWHTATLLPDGRVLVVGGGGGAGPTASEELWDPTTQTFSGAGSLAEARIMHSATLLPDGRVLVVGGASAEVWEPGKG